MPEAFSPAEADVLRRYFTNLDGPVFALVNLPEVVKGALFARYSRSPKSLRRLFIDEFVGELDISGDHTIDATVGLQRAEDLYEKVFVEYGDDSVAQLGGVHVACEQSSNVLTKALEWGRLMSYLEQSTRYIAYDNRVGGRYRFYRDPAILGSRFGTRYVGDMDRIFDAYGQVLAGVTDHVRATVDRDPADSEFIYRQATRAKALDAARGILPVGFAGQRRDLRQRAGVRSAPAAAARPPPARGQGVRRAHAPRTAQGHPELPPPRGSARPWWPVVDVPRDDAPAHRRARRFAVRRGAGDARRGGDARRLRPRRREQAARRDLLPARAPPGGAAPRQGRPARRRRAAGPGAGVRRRAGEPPPQAGASVRADRLPLRRARRLRRVPRPPTAPPADDRMAGAQPAARIRSPGTGRRRRAGGPVRRGDEPVGAAVRRTRRATSRSRRRTRSRWRTGCGS